MEYIFYRRAGLSGFLSLFSPSQLITIDFRIFLITSAVLSQTDKFHRFEPSSIFCFAGLKFFLIFPPPDKITENEALLAGNLLIKSVTFFSRPLFRAIWNIGTIDLYSV